MKSLITLVNTTGEMITRLSTGFPSGVPVLVYRNRKFLSLDEDFGGLVNDVLRGFLVGYAFDGTPNSPEETVETLNQLSNESRTRASLPSYSPDFSWKKSACIDLLDGTRKQLLDFDFGGVGVVKSLSDTLGKMGPTITCLNAGFLDFAITTLDSTIPDGDGDFLSAGRVATYRALFVSANTDI